MCSHRLTAPRLTITSCSRWKNGFGKMWLKTSIFRLITPQFTSAHDCDNRNNSTDPDKTGAVRACGRLRRSTQVSCRGKVVPGDTGDQRRRVTRRCSAAPRHVQVGTKKNQAATIDVGGAGVIDRQHFEWDATGPERAFHRGCIRASPAETEQHVCVATAILHGGAVV